MSIHQTQDQFVDAARVRRCRFCGEIATEWRGFELDWGCGLARWAGPRPGHSPMSPNQGKMLSTIMQAHPRPVSVSELVAVLYGDRADGGPDTADNAIRVQMYNLKHRLMVCRAPFRLNTRWGFGYYLAEPKRQLARAETIEKGK